MNWIEVTIKTTTEAVEAITNILDNERTGGVVIEDPKDFLFQKKNELDWDYVEEEVFNKSGSRRCFNKNIHFRRKKCNGSNWKYKTKSFRIKRVRYRYR